MSKLRDYLTHLTSEIGKLRVADRIYAIIAVLAVLTTLLLVMSVQSVRLQTAHRNEQAASARAALNIERVNGLIYAIVMESRGIYHAEDPGRLKYFSDELLRRNGELAEVVEHWATEIDRDDAAQFAPFKTRIIQFIEFRRELVRRAAEVSVAAGREWGANDANLTLRTALNRDLEALARTYTARASRVAELGDQTRLASWFLAALGIGALLLAALNVLVMRRFVVMPLADITAAADGITAGNFELGIPFTDRSDEIGRLARAVQKFRKANIDNLKLQQREVDTAKQRDAAIEQRDSLDDR
jgi:methyl-accepting chemotaxis protein